MRRKTFLIAMVLGAFLFTTPTAFIYAGGDDSQKVISIAIEGNKAVSSTTIFSKIKTAKGMTYSQDVVDDDIKRLYSLGFFSDVEIRVTSVPEGLHLTVVVTEKPMISMIAIIGNKKMREGHIRKRMKTVSDQIIDYSKLTADMDQIRSLYEEKGFPNVQVDFDVFIDTTTNKADVKIYIEEKSSVRISKISFQGNESFYDKELFAVMQTRKDTLFTSGVFKKDLFHADIENIKKFYSNKGYLDVDC